MLQIKAIEIENQLIDCVTDENKPVISFSLESDKPGTALVSAKLQLGQWVKTTDTQLGIEYDGSELHPFSEYCILVTAIDNHCQTAFGKTSFQTGRMDLPWDASWITDVNSVCKKGTSPVPMAFRKSFAIERPVKKAFITSTAIGIYDLYLNGQLVSTDYFSPGFTSYKKTLQYNYYDVTNLLGKSNELIAVVGAGWAVGRFTYNRKTHITADRQALLLELFIEYADGEQEKIITDGNWTVTQQGNYRFGDFYDGETYDATIDMDGLGWKAASPISLGFEPKLSVRYGCPVTAHEQLIPQKIFKARNESEWVYDFGQNFAGVVSLKITGHQKQTITIRHAEMLFGGDLSVNSLRTAKAAITYICKEGEQTYSPRLTYMGFRYIGISGIEPENIEVSAFAIYSDVAEIGFFECSNPQLNQIQRNIEWGGKSNFVDIPTDCPQRDERQGWTGDISVFASTACFNFDLSRFFGKWLTDVRLEQSRSGGIPFVVPRHGDIYPVVPTACWGDSCILVPWAEYMSRGDKTLLRKQYSTIKRYLKAVKWWAELFSFSRDSKRIWKLLFQFGDWCAPGTSIKDWMQKGKWVATAYFANSCAIAAKTANILGETRDQVYFETLHNEICEAYTNVFTDKNGKLKCEFQTAYVLPLYFQMVDGSEKANMAVNLAKLVEENDWNLSTGFTGTPYLLFALADNGFVQDAFRLLLQDTCPSWLYEIKAGATTFWEQWDAVSPDRISANPLEAAESDSEVSFNHYAFGAVGDFLYRRVAGIEPTSGGYKSFTVAPVLGGGLSWAKATHISPYGEISTSWKIAKDIFSLQVKVPVSTSCKVVLPSGVEHRVGSGEYTFSENVELIAARL